MTASMDTQGKRRGHILMRLMALVLLLLGSTGAWANGTCTGNGQAFSITMPASIAVPRDTPAGIPISGWFDSPSALWYTCNHVTGEYTGSAVKPINTTATGKTWTSGGNTFSLYDVGVPGVGIAFLVNFSQICNFIPLSVSFPVTDSGGTSAGWSGPPPAGWTGGSCGQNAIGEQHPSSGYVQAILITTGPVSPGVTTGGVVLDQAAYSTFTGILSNGHGSYSITPTVITVSACTTSNVTVPLGPHRTTELSGQNTGTPTSTGFVISLDNCPAGMNSIQYEIDNVTPILDNAQSVVALDGGSIATGVGVQLLNSAGTAAFPLRTVTTFTGYNKIAGGSYSIPFRARYYQTATSVGEGSANTSMTFTMTYQ